MFDPYIGVISSCFLSDSDPVFGHLNHGCDYIHSHMNHGYEDIQEEGPHAAMPRITAKVFRRKLFDT